MIGMILVGQDDNGCWAHQRPLIVQAKTGHGRTVAPTTPVYRGMGRPSSCWLGPWDLQCSCRSVIFIFLSALAVFLSLIIFLSFLLLSCSSACCGQHSCSSACYGQQSADYGQKQSQIVSIWDAIENFVGAVLLNWHRKKSFIIYLLIY